MKETTLNDIMGALERGMQKVALAFGKAGLSSYTLDALFKMGSALVIRGNTNPQHQKMNKLIQQRGLQGAREGLSEEPEPKSLEEKAALIKFFENDFPYAIRKGFEKIAKNLPYERKGQAPAFNDPKKEAEATEDLRRRLLIEEPHAFQNTAKKFRKSARAIYRLWKKHNEYQNLEIGKG